MNLAAELKAKANYQIIKRAKEFAKEIKPSLIESAEKGYEGHLYSLEHHNETQVFESDLFIQTLNEELDGVKVKLVEFYKTNIIFGNKQFFNKIHFYWGEATS